MVEHSDTALEENGPLLIGPAVVGIILNWWLFGILVMQYFMYCAYSASKDKKILQIVVHLLFALDTVQTIMTMVDAFNWFVYGFGNLDALLEFGTSSIDSPFMDGLIAFTVQIVYCWRVKVLSKRKVMPILIAFFSFVGGVNAIWVGIYGRIVMRVTNLESFANALLLLWLWSSAIADILIASSMSYLLLQLRSYHLRSGTVVAMKRVLVLCLETNLLTTAMAIATAILYVLKPLAPPRTSISLMGGYIIGKLYSNCFMVLLNQRIHRDNQDLERAESQELDVVYTSATSNLSNETAQRINSNHPKDGSGEVPAMQYVGSPSVVDLEAMNKASERSMIGLDPARDTTRPRTENRDV